MATTFERASTRVLAALLALGPLAGCEGAASDADNPYPAEAIEDVRRGAYTLSTRERCGGLPKVLGLTTPPGVCVGVVASGLRFPRGVAERANGDLIVVDMGGWAQNAGMVRYLQRNSGGTYTEQQVTHPDGARGPLLRRIDRPSGVAIGPDGFVYVGTPADIFRFDPTQRPRPVLEPVVRFPPPPPGARHPLTHFVFTPDSYARPAGPWTLYANIGSASDACETGTNASYPLPCEEILGDAPRGALRRIELAGPRPAGPRPSGGWPVTATSAVVARGLRNSMGIAVHPGSGLVLQAENARDAIHTNDPSLRDREGELPHEEINVVREGAHYGWPYCYDDNVPSPEYAARVRCDRGEYTAPAMLLPGHASPLALRYYTGSMFPEAYRGGLLATFHGGRTHGHRLAFLPTNPSGVPTGEVRDVIQGWEDRPASPSHPRGRPVDVIVGRDGSLFVTEDHNGTVLRVFYDPARGTGAPLVPETPVVLPRPDRNSAQCRALASRTSLFSRIQREVIDASCVEGCHAAQDGAQGGLQLDLCDDVGNATRLRRETGPGGHPWLVPGNPATSRLMLSLYGTGGAPRMPARGLPPEQIELVERWIREGAQIPAR